MNEPGISKQTFFIILSENYLKDNDEIIPYTGIKDMNRILRFFGFNYSYNTIILSDPKEEFGSYKYEVKFMFRWITWFGIKIKKQII